MRPVNIGEWTAYRGDHIVHFSASLLGNSVRVYQCEETPRTGWIASVEMPAEVLMDFAARVDRVPVIDERQMGMGL